MARTYHVGNSMLAPTCAARILQYHIDVAGLSRNAMRVSGQFVSFGDFVTGRAENNTKR